MRHGLRSAFAASLLAASVLFASGTLASARFAEPQSAQVEISPGMALVAIDNPPPGTAATLLSRGIAVIRDRDRYILAVTDRAGAAILTDLGLAWTVLDEPIEQKTYYAVGIRQGSPTGDLASRVRIVGLEGGEAIVEATAEEVAALIGPDFEFARIFMRPVRPGSAMGRLREEIGPELNLAPQSADPLIQQMVNSVSSSTISSNVQRMQNFVTRYSTTDSCQAAANWIKSLFESYGIDSVYFHHYSSAYKDNVVAVIPGTADPDKIVVIGGHYDSATSNANNCPGADDNATGTECVLECARILSQYQFNYTLVFIAFAGEEQGLYGSAAYAADAAARGDDIIGMIGVDMIGYLASGDALDLDIIDNANSLWLRNLVFDVAAAYVPNLPTVDGSLPGGAGSDHESFWDNGYDAILFFEDSGNYSPYIHTTSDVVGTSYNSPTLAERSIKIAIGLLATMAEPFRVAIVHEPLADTEDTENPYHIVADVFAAGTLNPDSLRVYYSGGAGWNGLTMTATANPDEYEAWIPAQPGGTWVDYYIVAEDTEGNRDVDPTGAPAEVHTFFVGTITPVFSDDFETNKGWTVGADGDNATTGIWARCDPTATVAQPEDDHTPAPGVNAYITQCAAGSAQGDYDVDGGRTTLLSPIFDLSQYRSAHVRYFRWYSNDTGSAPEADDWSVDVTDDGGATWVRLETLGSSDRTWRLIERDLLEHIDLTSQVRFRFVAADTGSGSIVEAGVDDFEIVTYEDAAAGVAGGDPAASGIALDQNAPNPFGGETTIRFVVPAPGARATMRIVDVAGREVKVLLDGERVAGKHALTWDGRNSRGRAVAAGVYFCELEVGDRTLLRKITLVR